jgi:predicted dehydrogenase
VHYSEPGGGYGRWVERTLLACVGEAEPPVTGRDGMAALRVIHAAYRSATEGRTVEVTP